MGLFTKKAPGQKAREAAQKAGIEVGDALAVAHAIQPDLHVRTLVVRRDRVELYDHGKHVSLLKAGAGVTTVEAGKITAVSSSQQLPWLHLTVTFSGGQVEYRSNTNEGAVVLAALQEIAG